MTKPPRRIMMRGAVLASLAAATAVAAGEEFSWQVSAGTQQLEIGDTVEVDGAALNATYYFRAVDDERGPYALAAFLSRSSHVGVNVHRDEEAITTQFSSPFTGTVTTVSETETEAWSISGRYVFPTSGWYAGAGYHIGDRDLPSSPSLIRDSEIEGYTLHFGKYLSGSTSVGLAWDATESREEIVALGCVAYPFCLPLVGHAITAEEASIRIMHVGTIGALAYSVSGNAASRRADIRFLPPVLLEEDDSPGISPPFEIAPGAPIAVAAPPAPSFPSLGRSRRYAGAFELFPTARLGVRAGYSRWDGDFQLDDAYDLSVGWFFVRNVNARITFARRNRKAVADEWSETDTVELALTGRF